MEAPVPSLLAPETGAATLKHRPWGGSRLGDLRAAPRDVARPIGESWEFSTMPGSESRAGGRPLSEVLGRPLSFLVKLIDTARPLSIQVHPDDDDATGTPGKEEAWVVLEADPGAEVLVGLRRGVDAGALAAAVRRAVADPACAGELLGLLQPVPVAKGSVILVAAGAIHSIGPGILLAEIQQPSDCTYRLYDYGSDRELHVEQALRAANVDARASTWQPGRPPTSLRGRHLELRILGQGRHERVATADETLVCLERTGVLTPGRETSLLPAGSLRLALTGTRYTVDVPRDGAAVVGALAC